MAHRAIGWVGLLGVAVSVAVGPGLSLTRCDITGKVTLSCCCIADPDPRDKLTSPDGCCTIQRLEAPWSGSQIPPQLAFGVAATPGVAAAFDPIPLASRQPDRSSMVDPGPPLWLATAALRI